MLCKGLNISSYRISWFIDIFHISLFQKSLFGLFLRRAIEFSSKCFTQIHCLFIPLRKSNNAVKFTVSLKQNSLEDFTTNGFSKILSWHFKTTKFCAKCPCATLDKNMNFNTSKNMLYVWTSGCLWSWTV